MFAVFSAASRVTTGESQCSTQRHLRVSDLTFGDFAERVVNYAFDLVSLIYKEHFALVVRYGSFADLTVCVTDFSKVTKFQKISLQAIDMLRGMVSKMLQLPETALPVNPQEDTKVPLDDPMAKYWFPVLFSFYDIIMTGADLEVRRL
jgi:brefeldin A-inhibited guanine nucleotide-exchange protein